MSDTRRGDLGRCSRLGQRIEALENRVEELTRQRDRAEDLAWQRLKQIRRLTEQVLDLQREVVHV